MAAGFHPDTNPILVRIRIHSDLHREFETDRAHR
jgi:hypothetical protein